MHENHPALPAQLMSKPALSFDELFVDLLGLPPSTAEEIARSDDRPPMFLLGRRRYVRTVDAIAWIDRIAERKPYFPRKNSKRFEPSKPPAAYRKDSES